MLYPGDIPGVGQIGSNPSIEESVLDCSERCIEETNCCSFEYSSTEKKCNLNIDCQPTTEAVYKDYSFCSKGNLAEKESKLLRHQCLITVLPKHIANS